MYALRVHRRRRRRRRRLKVVILGMNALRRLGEGDSQMHAAHFPVVHVDQRLDGLFQRRHRDVRHLPIVLEELRGEIRNERLNRGENPRRANTRRE